MDCCENKEESKKNEMKGGSSKMNKKIVMWIVIGVLVLAVVYLTFKAGNTSSAGAVVQSAGAVKSAAQSAASGMVGGC